MFYFRKCCVDRAEAVVHTLQVQLGSSAERGLKLARSLHTCTLAHPLPRCNLAGLRAYLTSTNGIKTSPMVCVMVVSVCGLGIAPLRIAFACSVSPPHDNCSTISFATAYMFDQLVTIPSLPLAIAILDIDDGPLGWHWAAAVRSTECGGAGQWLQRCWAFTAAMLGGDCGRAGG